VSDDDLRPCEREAAEHPGAPAFTKLAFALARAGRENDALRAAFRALSADASSAARELLLPGWPWGRPRGPRASWRAVSWPGLRSLRGSRPMVGVPGGDISRIWDLGHCIVSYIVGDDLLLGVDVFEERVLWRRDDVERIGVLDRGLLVRSAAPDGTTLLEVLDPALGEARGPRIETGIHARSCRLLDEKRVVLTEELEGTTRERNLVALSTFDLDTGERTSRCELPPLRIVFETFRVGGGVVFGALADADERGLRGFGLDGREVCRLPVETDIYEIDGCILYYDAAGCVLLDPQTKERRVARADSFAGYEPGPLTTDSTLLYGNGSFYAFDRRTLECRWQCELPLAWPEWYVAATRNAILVIAGSRGEDLALHSLDPETGRELAVVSIDLGSSVPVPFQMAVVGGRILIGSAVPGTLDLQVIEEA
jgi:hypothetical protein